MIDNTKSYSTTFRLLRYKWLQCLLALGITITLLLIAWTAPWPFYFSINASQSLPYKAFIVIRSNKPEVGDYVDFWPPHNTYYSDISFIKRVVAKPDDTIKCVNRLIYIDQKFVATAKAASRNGALLKLGPCGRVPDNHFYVLAPHLDSFDSRYQEIGYVPFEAVRGVAYPLF